MIRGLIQPSRIGDSFAISLVMQPSPNGYDDHRILRLDSKLNRWETYDPYGATETEPTLRLAAYELLALEDALAEQRYGTSDLRALRAQLDKESGRLDKCLDVLLLNFGGAPAAPLAGGRR